MVTISRVGLSRHKIQVSYANSDDQTIFCRLSESVAKYFLSFLSCDDLQKLNEKGSIATHREQFGWLPTGLWRSDGLPEHERHNLNAFISQQQVSK